jgi:CheY-like chemotaxis protein
LGKGVKTGLAMAKVKTLDGRTRVAVVDDNADTRLWFRGILQPEKKFNFAGGFSTAGEALTAIPCLQPDMVLLDLNLPDMDGIKCTRRLRQLMARLRVVIVSGNREAEWFDQAIDAGAVAYLIKPLDPAQLIATLRFVAGSMNETIGISPKKSGTDPTAALNPREREYRPGFQRWLNQAPLADRASLANFSGGYPFMGSSPESRRLFNRDPISEAGGLNLYVAMLNDPLGYIDPFGLADLDLKADPTGIAIANSQNDPNAFVVNAHGNPTTVYDAQSGRWLTADDLANMIRNSPNYKPGEPVKLQICQTGRGPFAQNLADKLQAPVLAPVGDWVGNNHGQEEFLNPDTLAPDPKYGYRQFNPPMPISNVSQNSPPTLTL